MLSISIFLILTYHENGQEENEERETITFREERGGDSLTDIGLSQLNPLAGAINILIMMSDEPRGRRTKRIGRGQAGDDARVKEKGKERANENGES